MTANDLSNLRDKIKTMNPPNPVALDAISQAIVMFNKGNIKATEKWLKAGIKAVKGTS